MKYLTLLLCLAAFNLYAESRFATYNIRMYDARSGITDKVELKKIITELDADFITVEEIVNSSSLRNFVKNEFPLYDLALSKCGGGGNQKIGFIYKKSKYKLNKLFEDRRLSSVKNQKGCGSLRPALIGYFTDLSLQKDFVAIGLHLKAGSGKKNYDRRNKQFKILVTIVEEIKRKGISDFIIMGDLNTTGFIDQNEDYKNFNFMLNKINVKTGSTQLNCTSYWSGEDSTDNIEEASILDHVIPSTNFLNTKSVQTELFAHCKKSLCENVSADELGTSYLSVSDHCPVLSILK